MNILLLALGISATILAIALISYLLTARRYQSADTVADSYDEWTEDGILEYYWGEHIHLGHYGNPPRAKNFLKAKADFVHEMVRWGGLDQLPLEPKCWMWAVASVAVAASSRETMALT